MGGGQEDEGACEGALEIAAWVARCKREEDPGGTRKMRIMRVAFPGGRADGVLSGSVEPVFYRVDLCS